MSGSASTQSKIGPLRIGKMGPLRIGKNKTPPDWQNWDPSGYAKIGPLRVCKIITVRIGRIGTPSDWLNWDFSGLAKLEDPSGFVKVASRKLVHQCPADTHCTLFEKSFLAYSYNHAFVLALNHGIRRLLAHIFFTSIGMFKILHIVSKRSKSFRKSNFCTCSLVGASCLLFSFT